MDEIVTAYDAHHQAGLEVLAINLTDQERMRDVRKFAEDLHLPFPILLDQHGKAFEGVTYSYKTTEFYGKALAKGTIHTGTKKVILEELKIVELRMRQGNDACIMTCFMQYSKSGDEEFLEGTYVSMNTRDSSDCGRGTLFLRKVPVSDFYKEPFLANKACQ